jgi:hypothetical protein
VTSHHPSHCSVFSSSRGIHSPIAATAPSLRPLAPSGSLLRASTSRCITSIQSFSSFFQPVGAKLIRMADAPTYPALLKLTLLVGFSSVLQGVDPSTMPSSCFDATRWTSRLLASRTLVRKSSCRSPLTSSRS